MAKSTDVYSQFMYMSVTMSAANTLTFNKVALGISMFDYAGLLIQRIEYSPTLATMGEMKADTDQLTIAVTGSQSIAALGGDQAEVYDRITLLATHAGTPANFWIHNTPFVHDFFDMPGGGILVPAQDIYLAMITSGFVAAGSANVRMYYTITGLQAADYLELVQRLRVLST